MFFMKSTMAVVWGLRFQALGFEEFSEILRYRI